MLLIYRSVMLDFYMTFLLFSNFPFIFVVDIFVFFCYITAMEKIDFLDYDPQNINSIPKVSTTIFPHPWNCADVAFGNICNDYPMLHTHFHWELLIILSGSVIHEINGQVYTLKKGDACFIRPQDCHRLFNSRSTDASSYLCLNFPIQPDFLMQYCSLMDKGLYDRLNQSQDILSFMLDNNLFLEVVNKTTALRTNKEPTDDDLLNCKLIFTRCIACFLEYRSGFAPVFPAWLSDFLVQLHDINCFSVPLPELARHTPYSYFRLTRVFKQYTGLSLTDYLTNVKLEYAKSLLKNTDMTILDVSSKLEFTASYFSKLFKKQTGVTPGEYRKGHYSG